MKAVFDLDSAVAEIGHLVKNMRMGEEYDVRIDRKTRWGNPFVKANEAGRRACVEQYFLYARLQIIEGRWTLAELAELHNKRLACWCSPKYCHGHVLAWMAKRAHEHISYRKAA